MTLKASIAGGHSPSSALLPPLLKQASEPALPSLSSRLSEFERRPEDGSTDLVFRNLEVIPSPRANYKRLGATRNALLEYQVE